MKNQFTKITLFLKEQKAKINAVLRQISHPRKVIVLRKNPLKTASVSWPKWLRLPSFSVSGRLLKGLVVLQTVILLGVLGFGGWFYMTKIRPGGDDLSKKRELPQSIVEALPVEVGVFNTFTSAVGTLKANESVVIRPQIEGTVKEIRFQSGDAVAKGDPLIFLEDSLYKAMLNEAQAKLELYKGKYERARILYERRSGTLKERDEMFAQMRITQAEVDKAKAQLAKTVLRAPFDGVIGLKNISAGAYVRVGEDLVTLDHLDPMKIEFRLGENMIDKVSIGKSLEVEVDGFPDNVFEAKVEAIDTNIDPMGHSLRVRALLENKEELFKPGLYVKVKLLTNSHENVVMVPESAVESRGNQEYVYRVEDGKARYTPVKTGGRNGEKVEILAGLESGQTVIVAGQMKVQDKWPVMAVPPYVLKRF